MYSRNRISEEFLLWVGAKENIGLDTKYPGMKINEKQRSDKNYQILVKLEDGHPIHELEINKKFLQGLGIVVISYVPKLWFIYNEIGPLNTVLKGRQKKNFIIIGIVPGAYDSYRTWGGAKFQTLMRELCYMHKEIIFFIFGNKSDQKYLDYLSLKNDEIIDLRGKTSLRELATLLYHCDIVIGNETGPLHIANAIGTKSFCILGGGHFGRFYPYPHSFDLKEIPSCFFQFRDCFSCGWHCIYSLTDNNSYRCIHEVSVEYVIKDVAAYIEDLFLENKNSKEKHSDAS
jgi:ADP-heptose:LPS heptosyltransferase